MSKSIFALLLLVLAAAAGCSSGNGDDVLNGAPCEFLDGSEWNVTQMDPETSQYEMLVEASGNVAVIYLTEDGCGEEPETLTLDNEDECEFVLAFTSEGQHNATCTSEHAEETRVSFTETTFSATFWETVDYTGTNCPPDDDYSGTASGARCDDCWPCG